ncbi:polysaccharide biosynthesis protein [Intrasporangium sp.]|uniref:polysaccharide biosynthesis protein n=1 Tax=Intrasporangium sp. TaxID=1925024 RepID=UPI003221917A
MVQGSHRRARVMGFVWAIVDAVVWVLAIYVTRLILLGFSVGVFSTGLALAAAVAFVAHLVIGHLVGPYAAGHIRRSFDEVLALTVTVLLNSIGLFAWSLFHEGMIPRGTGPTAGASALIVMFALRFAVRTYRAHRTRERAGERRALIFGSDGAGRRLLHNVIHDESSKITPVGLFEDDRSKQRIEGYRRLGTRQNLAAVAMRTEADTRIIALPNADSALLRDLSERASEACLEALILPPPREIIGGRPTPGDLRRKPVHLDTSMIKRQLTGKRILVTSAGGSFGSELCRQIAQFEPGRLIMLDRDESGLQATQLSMTGHGLLESDDIVLANIRDTEALTHIFECTRPEIVFHAAALKHLPLLEAYPLEAWKNNVLGTLNVLEAAARVGVEVFVNISTDKAANPTSVLGYSKRVAKRLTAGFAACDHGRYVSVRLGNILGLRGSVVHLFREQIERGDPVTVTHPAVKRYFMLIPEACRLVLEAATIGREGEVMVPEMEDQVKIVDVAETMIRMSGRHDIEITFTDLRDGENLGEELFAQEEGRRKTEHPLVDSVGVPPISTTQVTSTSFLSHHAAAAWMGGEATTAVHHQAVAG